jgi:hypothetical protein
MIHDKKLLGVCGETELANAKQSLITMMQVKLTCLVTVYYSLTHLSGVRVFHFPSYGQGI